VSIDVSDLVCASKRDEVIWQHHFFFPKEKNVAHEECDQEAQCSVWEKTRNSGGQCSLARARVGCPSDYTAVAVTKNQH